MRDVRTRWLILAYGLVLALWSPWLPVLLAQRRQVGETFWLPPMSWWQVARTSYQMFAPPPLAAPSVEAAVVALAACVLGLALLLRRGGPPGWFLFLTAAVPFVASGALSFLQFNIWLRQYFLFAHLSLLATIAVLIGRVRSHLARGLVAAAVLLASFGVYDVYGRWRAARATVPGAKAAAALLDERRAPGEMVIVCSPMMTPCVEGHSRLNSGWRTYKPAGEYPHYTGTAVIRPGEYITPEEISLLDDARVWVVDVERWEKGTIIIPVPNHWSRKGEWRIPEIYGVGCEIIVREYEISPPIDLSGLRPHHATPASPDPAPSVRVP